MTYCILRHQSMTGHLTSNKKGRIKNKDINHLIKPLLFNNCIRKSLPYFINTDTTKQLNEMLAIYLKATCRTFTRLRNVDKQAIKQTDVSRKSTRFVILIYTPNYTLTLFTRQVLGLRKLWRLLQDISLFNVM